MAGAEERLPGGLGVPDGILVVDKPEGPTSHDVVARARRALGVRQIGHAGTLDPIATGVLALLVGRATRLAQFLSGHRKQYTARVRLGLVTDTWDRTGAEAGRMEADALLPGAAEIRRVLDSFLGEHEQLPPRFSAKKIEGVRAYELARQGRPAAVKTALVTLHSVRVLDVEPPFVTLDLTCSAGFYVRALAHELGARLGCGGCLDALRRTASGGLTIDSAVALETLETSPESAVARMVPLDAALADLPSVVLTEAGSTRALHGNEIGRDEVRGPGEIPASAAVRLFDEGGRLLAIARPAARPGVLHPAVVLK